MIIKDKRKVKKLKFYLGKYMGAILEKDEKLKKQIKDELLKQYGIRSMPDAVSIYKKNKHVINEGA